MPVSVVLCEGRFDAEVLGALLPGVRVRSVPGGGKFVLAQRVGALCQPPASLDVVAVRDRDFDYDVPIAGPGEEVHQEDGVDVRIYYWSGHELENYLLLPDLVEPAHAAAAWFSRPDYDTALAAGARQIASYAAARKSLSQAREALPRRLPNRYNEQGHLPPDLSVGACRDWILAAAQAHGGLVADALDAARLNDAFEQAVADYGDEAFVANGRHLVELPGSDLARALDPYLGGCQPSLSHGDLLRRVRDWILDHPDEAVTLVPEWQRLRELVLGA